MAQPRVAIYARVSTYDQSPDAQLRDLREYVRNRNFHGAKEFVDIGESGSKESRPQWNEVWNAICKRRIDILVVHALDRLGRSLPHLVKILGTLVEQGITLISYRENIDLSTAAGRLFANLISVLADFELSLIRERTRSGMRAAKARSSRVGNPMRFFDKGKATELRDQGYGQIRIARALGVGVGRVNAFCRDEYVPADRRKKIN
jgi:putative DNA-invertase from lambdoid prophage Rac